MIKSSLFVQSVLLLICLLCTAVLQADDWIYRIRPGETLSSISARFLLPNIPVTQLQTYNNIENDRDIAVGTEIRVPLDWLAKSLAAVQVLYVYKEAELYRKGISQPVKPKVGDRLQLGDRIVTKGGAILSLRFADGSRLMLGPDSEIVLDTLSAYGETGMLDTRIRIQHGRVENQVEPLRGEGARYEIHTPAAVTMVRGTGFRIGVETDSGLTRSEVTEGHVGVDAEGESLDLTAGFGTLVEPGEPPAPPVKLLGPPDLSSLPQQTTAGPFGIEWSPLDGAKGYRLQLQSADETKAVLHDALVSAPSYTFDDLQVGKYLVLVRGIDELGLEGLTAQQTLRVDQAVTLPVEPPLKKTSPPQRAPELDMPQFGPGWIDFRWSEVEHAWGYRLLLARDLTFQAPLFERIGSSTHLRLPIYWQGRLFVRVDALFQADPEEAHSEVFRLELPGR